MNVRRLLSGNRVVVVCVTFFCLLGWTAAAQAAAPPVIEGESVDDVILDAATLQARLNPEGSETTYSFEYGRSTAYGSTAPIPYELIGSGTSAETVEARIKGLTAGTTYHYRVLATSGGVTVYGGDKSFRTFTVAPSSLPDERAYELVSPPNKNGGEIDDGVIAGDVAVPLQASEDGSAVTYASVTSFEAVPGEAKGSAAASSYISRRNLNGWVTQNVTPPFGLPHAADALNVQSSTIEGMTPDLSSDFYVSDSGSLPGAFPGYMMPYLQNNLTGVVEPLSSVRPPNHEPFPSPFQEFDPVFAGESNDASHVIFSANDTLTPEATGEESNLYEWIDGHLSLVNILPDGSAVSSEKKLAFGMAKFVERVDLDHAISTDGSRVFWTDENDEKLFARVNGTSTILISGSQKTNGSGPGGTDPLGTELPVYQTASADGSYVFFTSTEELTNDSNTGDAASCAPLQGDCAADLYRYDMQTGQLADLTADAADTTGGGVWGVLGSSEDGSYVYFVANGALASGATPGNCSQAEGGGFCNLYVWHEGSGTSFITRLSQASLGSGPLVGGMAQKPFNAISSENLELRTSRISPNGRFMAFQSEQSLTGYDNTLADGSHCSGPDYFYGTEVSPACPEVFLYEADSNHLTCASCNPTGGRPIGPSVLPFRVGANAGHALRHSIGGSGWMTEVYQQRYLGDSGRLFFNTVDALSPGDTNGQGDVYEYENGEARLISGGFGGEASVFFDAELERRRRVLPYARPADISGPGRGG